MTLFKGFNDLVVGGAGAYIEIFVLRKRAGVGAEKHIKAEDGDTCYDQQHDQRPTRVFFLFCPGHDAKLIEMFESESIVLTGVS